MDSELSLVSKKYDVEGKGHLTKEQQTLRNLDREGKGHLSAEDLAPLMEEYRNLHEDNVKSRRLLIVLFISVVLLGIGTIVASVLAVNASKDMAISPEGVLMSKHTNNPLITTSQGVSVTTKEIVHPDTGSLLRCLPLSSIANLYVSFSRGMDVILHINNTLSSENGFEGENHSLSIMKITGNLASFNDTKVNIGNVAFDVSPENPCNILLNSDVAQHGDVRKLFKRHLQEIGPRNWSRHNLPECNVFNSQCSDELQYGSF